MELEIPATRPLPSSPHWGSRPRPKPRESHPQGFRGTRLFLWGI